MATKTKKYALPKEFTVTRSRWARGDTAEYALHDNTTNTMCCLGFACRAAGLTVTAITDHTMPVHTGVVIRGLTHKAMDSIGDTRLAVEAAAINDDPLIDDAEREKKLTALFGRHGYRIKFV